MYKQSMMQCGIKFSDTKMSTMSEKRLLAAVDDEKTSIAESYNIQSSYVSSVELLAVMQILVLSVNIKTIMIGVSFIRVRNKTKNVGRNVSALIRVT